MTRASAAAVTAANNGLIGVGSTNVVPDIALHVGDPGTTGANENANSGGYVRQATSWTASGAGTGNPATNSTSLTFSTGGTVAVSYWGGWSSAVYGGGTYAIGGPLGVTVTAASITAASGALGLQSA